MPTLPAPQLALLRQQSHRSTFYLFPVVPATVFAARINDPTITVGENTIIFDSVTTGAFTDILPGMTVWCGTAPNTYNVARIRVRSATSAHIVVAENSDVAWADNYYLTVKREWLCWSVRQFISAGTVFKDFDVAFASQTINWRPVAMMGDSAIQIFDGNPTSIYFDSAESYPVKAGATIASRAWAFGDGGTSVATTPGNHGYAAAGVYYPTLTVTDTNGQTHLTRRIAALPNRADCYTAFECTSLEGEIDGGWTANFTVRGVSDVSEFPDRAPIFFFAEDSYGVTDGSVGFPTGRENIILFGYIQASSVVLNPETSECTFIVESLAGQMARELPTPASVHDVVTPAAWDEGQDLNIFRSLFYLLKYQSTVFDIADVKLYNDTTLIKYSDFPEDSLWNMLAQFAQGTRLMRCGVTRTGRLVVARDPNLMTIASRVAIVTVCQLQAGDWITEVTIPQVQFPVTCFLCLSGISYDGIPANDPSPLFGMSPGHPPKEYGSTRQLADLALVDQNDANEKAGLLVGQDNNVYGPVIIPLAGNWSRAFDPAYQEYVQAPTVGFPTQRGLLLFAQYLIVRKVSVNFEWQAGAMFPTLTCEAYSYPDISTNGDCYTPDAPQEPTPVTPPIIPPPPPVLQIDPPVIFFTLNYCISLTDTPVIEVDWSFATDPFTAAYLERSPNGVSGWTVIHTDPYATSDFYFEDADIVFGNTYYYRVRFSVGGFYSAYSDIVAVAATVFCTPELALVVNCPTLVLTWNDLSGAIYYQVERSLLSGSGYSVIATVYQGAETYSDTPNPADRYYYRIKGFNGAYSSSYSNVVNATGGDGTETFPTHVVYSTEDTVWETHNFNGANYCQPDWVDITGSLPSGGVMQWDGADTLKILAGGDGMIYTRSISGGGAWTPIAASAQQYALDHDLWQSIFDPNSAFPGCDCTVLYGTQSLGALFVHFVGNEYVLTNSPGVAGFCSAGYKLDQFICAFVCEQLPKPGWFLTDGNQPIWTKQDWFLPQFVAAHISRTIDEPVYIVMNQEDSGPSEIRIYSGFGTNFAYSIIDTDPCTVTDHDMDTGAEVYQEDGGPLYMWQADNGNSAYLWIWVSGTLKRSSNGGVSFTDMGVAVLGEPASLDIVAAAGVAASIIRAATGAGVNTTELAETVDGGATWQTGINGVIYNSVDASGDTSDPGNWGLYHPPQSPDLMLLAGGPTGGLQKSKVLAVSEDGGLRWYRKNVGVGLTPDFNLPIVSVWINPST